MRKYRLSLNLSYFLFISYRVISIIKSVILGEKGDYQSGNTSRRGKGHYQWGEGLNLLSIW